MAKVFVLGYPGDMGGANTECWHTVKLWRRLGYDVTFVPTWGYDPKWKANLDAIGCETCHVKPESLETVPDLPGAITVGFCNAEYILHAHRLRKMGCKIVWVNCMTFMFPHEVKFFTEHGPADAMVYQSEFQRSEIEPQLQACGYDPASGHLIRGAFDTDAWQYSPQTHVMGEPFIVGRAARPAPDKWSSQTWKIYEAIQYPQRRALMLGVDDRTLEKLGPTPEWASCLRPRAIPVEKYYQCLHCLMPINGGARENWPRAGLEAFACGVPVVTQNAWGWREMIEHGVTGFLASNDQELAHYAAVLAYDEPLRMRIVDNARRRLIDTHANPDIIAAAWKTIFDSF